MTSTDFRSSASFGKRQEYIAVAELLRRRFDVYMTLVDDLQIDCIIRLPGKPPSYIDIQIKARSKTAKNASTFAALEIREPRENFLFLFYSEACNTYWVMPSLWPAPGSADTELGVLMEPEVSHGTAEVYTRVQA
jgi:hypothetical protein